jgi:hypothetical protein
MTMLLRVELNRNGLWAAKRRFYFYALLMLIALLADLVFGQ